MTPENIAKVLNYRGPQMFNYIRQCVQSKLAPEGLSVAKVEDFMRNHDKVELDEEQRLFLIDCLQQRFTRVETYDPYTGELTGSGMVRIASTKSAAPVIMPPRSTTLAADDRLSQYLGKKYAVGQGATTGPTTAAKPLVTNASAEERFAERKAAEAARDAAKPGKVKAAALSLMTFGR